MWKIVSRYFTLVHNGNQAPLKSLAPPKHNIRHNTYNLWWSYWYVYHINPFHATVLFLYPLKKTGGLWFSDVFRGYRKRTLNGVMSVELESCIPQTLDKNLPKVNNKDNTTGSMNVVLASLLILWTRICPADLLLIMTKLTHWPLAFTASILLSP